MGIGWAPFHATPKPDEFFLVRLGTLVAVAGHMRVSRVWLVGLASWTVGAAQLIACGSGGALGAGGSDGGYPSATPDADAAPGSAVAVGPDGGAESPNADANANANGGPIDGGVGSEASRLGDPSSPEGGARLPTMACGPDASTVSFDYSDPAMAETWTGMGSSYVDSCDSNGNLVKHSCEAMTSCAGGPNPVCASGDTGAVKTWQVDCAGHCVDGTCPSRCPQIGDTISFQSVDADGGVVVTDTVDGRRFDCTLASDQPDDGFDCISGVHAGTQANMTTQGLMATYCTGAHFGSIGVCFPSAPSCNGQNCAYACSVAP